LSGKVIKVVMPKFISSETFEDVWLYLYNKTLSVRCFASSKSFANAIKAASFLRIGKMLEKLWFGFLESFHEKSLWACSDPEFLQVFNELSLLDYQKVNPQLLYTTVYFVILKIVQEGRVLSSKSQIGIGQMNQLILEDILLLSVKDSNRELDAEMLKSIVKVRSKDPVQFINDRYHDIHGMMGYEMMFRNGHCLMSRALASVSANEAFKDRDYIEVHSDELKPALREEINPNDEIQENMFRFAMGAAGGSRRGSPTDKDCSLKFTINGLSKSSIIITKAVEIIDFELTMIFNVDENFVISVGLVASKLKSPFKVVKTDFKIKHQEFSKDNSFLFVFTNGPSFIHHLSNVYTYNPENNQPLEVELFFNEDIVTEGFLSYFARNFLHCEVKSSDTAQCDFPPSLSHLICLPFPFILALVSSSDLNVPSESQILFFVKFFIHELFTEFDLNNSFLKDLKSGRDQGLDRFRSIYAAKSRSEKNEIASLMFSSIRLEYVETNFLLAFISEDRHLGESAFRRQLLVRRLAREGPLCQPRFSYSKRRPEAIPMQAHSVVNDIVVWLAEGNQHTNCRRAIEEKKQKIAELNERFEKADMLFKQKTEAFQEYKRRQEERSFVGKRVKREESFESGVPPERSFLSKFCLIF
jgi:hypothetical protein